MYWKLLSATPSTRRCAIDTDVRTGGTTEPSNYMRFWSSSGIRRRRTLYVAKKHSRSVVADDVVAALTFGFWGGLLASGGPLQFETAYWQPFLHRAFPHYVGSRADLHIDVNSLRLFRNRIAHHEPVFNRHLAADHATVVRVAGYIHPDCATYIDSHSRVPEVLARKARAVDHGYATRF